MPRYLNTDNGQILTIADHEALIYEAASNFQRVEDAPAPAPVDEAEASKAGAALSHHKAEEQAASKAGRELQAHKTQSKRAPKKKA